MESEVSGIAGNIVTAVIAGLVSTLGTVKALGVHITYLNQAIARLEAAIQRAHERIDYLERELARRNRESDAP